MKMLTYILFVVAITHCSVMAVQPTFADLAVFMAKGFFRNYVSQDASLGECVAFLNEKGVGFSLFDIIDSGKTAAKEDLARVMGQSILLFSGEAELLNGSVKRPSDAETWVDYCLLNDIDCEPVWSRLVQCAADGSLPEVRAFFKE